MKRRPKVARGCPLPEDVQWAIDGCKHCPLSIPERLEKCKWFRNLRERYIK